MAKKLVIVESPTKAKTITKFLGRGYTVLSSFGHVRDLPKNELGVDVDNDFKPHYVTPMKSRKIASEIKRAAAKASAVYFASDEDREGEAISWHLQELLKVDPKKAHRITFHEITSTAVETALKNPREINQYLVDAQQARRILDRLVGYKLSPFLWHKVARGLSAGRVQSVVVRLLVEREREILAFKPQEYWSVEAMLSKRSGPSESFLAKLIQKDGATLDKFALPDAASAEAVVNNLHGASWKTVNVEKKLVHKKPLPPFTTSTLQQEANNRLGYSSKQTMTIAQQLYEGVEIGDKGHTGVITYMRTDSVNLADKFIDEARTWLKEHMGGDSVPETPRKYHTSSKSAQEAHEAIRPTDPALHPKVAAKYLDTRQSRLYELIWRRAMASQMSDAEVETVTADIDATSSDKPRYTFRATGSTVIKQGYLEVYESETKEGILPELNPDESLDANSVTPKQHFTEPPPRYTEASLVKSLEENGIGRPSTYAPTISTVVDRGYVEKDGRKLKPTELATVVNDLLVEHFPDIVNLDFTARMEADLDEIAAGSKQWVPVIREFYSPFEINLRNKEKEVTKQQVAEQATEEKCEKCGKPMVIKMGRFGKFLACTGFPECHNTKSLEPVTPGGGVQATVNEKCEKCGSDMVMKRGRFGPFMSCSSYPKCKNVKPIQKKIGVKCPACGEGEIIEKKTRKGKMFYACSRYPSCKFALWNRPTGDTCDKCNSLLVLYKPDTVRCSNTTCKSERKIGKEE